MTDSERITKYLFALTVSTHPVLPPPPTLPAPLHLSLLLLLILLTAPRHHQQDLGEGGAGLRFSRGEGGQRGGEHHHGRRGGPGPDGPLQGPAGQLGPGQS